MVQELCLVASHIQEIKSRSGLQRVKKSGQENVVHSFNYVAKFTYHYVEGDTSSGKLPFNERKACKNNFLFGGAYIKKVRINRTRNHFI